VPDPEIGRMPMQIDQAIVIAVLAAALALFVWGRWRFDLVAMAALVVLTVCGIVPVGAAFQGFGHPAVVTVAAVLVIGRAIELSGVVEVTARRVANATTSPTLQVLLLCALVAVCSSFMNNVAALALLMPIALHSAEVLGRPVSQVLMPLSFSSLLGGLTTLIGTPPNIIIANFRKEISGHPFDVFDFTPVGVGVAICGVLFISFLGWRLVPNRRHRRVSDRLFEISDYVGEVRVHAGSKLIDKSPTDISSGDGSLRVMAIVRQQREVLSPVPWISLQAGDVLLVEGDPKSLRAIAADASVDLANRDKNARDRQEPEDTTLIEAIVRPGSELEYRRVNTAVFRRRYGTTLVAISRQGRPISNGLRDLLFRVGDVLLLRGQRDVLPDLLAYIGCLPLAERPATQAPERASPMPVLVFAAAIACSAAGLVDVQLAFVTVAVLLVAGGFVPPREVYTSISWPVIILIGALLPVGEALRDTGATHLLAGAIADASGMVPTVVLIGMIVLASMLLSDVINNAAAAIVMAPLAVSIARDLGAPVDSLLMAVAVGSSCTFLTPIGHQSNTLVMGPGGYRFSDYWRMGLPLGGLVVVLATVLIAVVWGTR
jgi:di/tricarboxylate transporter